MKCRQITGLAAILLLTTALSTTVQSQGLKVGNRLIPQSSLQFAADIGKRAHTHTQILVGAPRGGWGFLAGLGPGGGMTPAQLRQAYNLPSTGGSQIIAIVDAYDDSSALSDFNSFSSQFGLPQETSANATASTNKAFQIVYANGTKPSGDPSGGWEVEEALDIEWAHAMAPGAKILLVEAASTSFTDLLHAEDVATAYVDGNGLSVREVSNSWGGSEFGGENSYDSHFSGSTAVYFAAAGDSGLGAEYPSASPYIVSAGGTSVATDSNGVFLAESAWSGGGGGPSSQEARPAFQNGISAIVGASRGTPDISFDSDPNTGVAVYDSYPYEGNKYTWFVVGGTSAASPSLAGIANLAATAEDAFPAGSQALLANIYSNLGTANLRDITTGSNGDPAGPGWDFATGVGSCLGLGAMQTSGAAGGPSITNLSPNSATAGGASFTLTVNGSGFESGAVVDWQGTGLATTFISASQVTASVPASDIATAGSASVSVINPGGAASNDETFTINSANNPAPILTGMSPNSARHGTRSVTITLTGSQFISSSQVIWVVGRNSYVLPVNFVSSTQLTVTISSTLLRNRGTAAVHVSNPGPGGGNSASKTFTIN